MEDLPEDITYGLAKPFSYHLSGGVAQAEALLLRAPSNKQRHQFKRLQGYIGQALKALQSEASSAAAKAADESAEGGIDKDMLFMVLTMSDSIDLDKCNETFRELLLNDIAFVADAALTKLTSTMFDKIMLEDNDGMFKEYIHTFLFCSWKSMLAKK